ncbi:MAG: serine hydrolase [Lachnospiraceae bacterium]|nr:serine hydrolase [Lachnospiraceae bacterium]MDD3659323.1 serine hydrolase [Lachnospiraceae bacterium]
MRCTNNSFRISTCIVTISMLGSIVTGCSNREIDMAYNYKMPVSSYTVTDTSDAETAESFASDLCVTASDVIDGTDVDLTDTATGALFDLNHNSVLYAKNIHEKLYPASLTKVMTALVVLKYGKLEDTINVTDSVNITESGAQLCGLSEGDTITVDQALHALLINSANDAAVALAEHIGGSVEGFAEMMNQEALSIGATNSHFVNPHGLSDDNHYVTAYDMYLIFNEAVKYERFTQIIQMTAYETVYHDRDGADKELSFQTTNQYLQGVFSPPANVTVIGGKTGTTNAAGNCLIIYSKDTSGNPYISVILRSKEREILYGQMTDILSEIGN